MKAKMTHAARRELVDAIRSRYRAASGKAKRRILEEFIVASGYHEKSAIRVFNEAPSAEHPFGTLKAWMGSTHFLTRTLPRVSTEMSLHVLAYNMKRLLQIFGTRPLIQMMRV